MKHETSVGTKRTWEMMFLRAIIGGPFGGFTGLAVSVLCAKNFRVPWPLLPGFGGESEEFIAYGIMGIVVGSFLGLLVGAIGRRAATEGTLVGLACGMVCTLTTVRHVYGDRFVAGWFQCVAGATLGLVFGLIFHAMETLWHRFRDKPVGKTENGLYPPSDDAQGIRPGDLERGSLMSTVDRPNNARDLYFELVRRLPLRPIRSDKELDEAVEMVASLLGRQDLAREEKDYLEVLGDLIYQFESETHPMPPVSDAEMLRHLIEAKGVSQAELSAATGIADSTISAILAGKQQFSRDQIGKLAQYFRVSPDVFSF